MKDTPLGTSEIADVNGLLCRGFYSTAFQPILHTGTRSQFGFEALLRGPAGTPLAMPARVFDYCEAGDPSLLLRLDKACIGSAVRTARLLPQEEQLFINIHGNTALTLSPVIFMRLLEELGIDPGRIIFEISERTSEKNIREVAVKLAAFRAHGIRVALDDVGVGHPWLSHLLWLEPDFVKLDRALITGIDGNLRQKRLVGALVPMVDRMGATLIAEGIETPEEHEALVELGVALVQGYYFGMPMPADMYTGGSCGLDFCPVSGLSDFFPAQEAW
ncbi:MAG: EAL domain-containing protein [Nitrospirae bacterium]|nr:EAL domain-containing protein [Nitrospirota bacterium]